MKILHTGDWHIGKIVNDYSLLEDQRHALKQFFTIIENDKPDCIIISGDVYDRSIPPKEAVELLDETLTKIISKFHIPTILISGNHDSQERLSFGNKLLESNNLFIQGIISKDTKVIQLTDEFGPINFYLLPYSHPANIASIFNKTVSNHQEAFEVLINKLKLNKTERNILITHNYMISDVTEILISDSERNLSVGGTEYIDVELVKDFDYVALGHLHQPQKVKYEHVRYSGSLLKYSFSEVNRNKGVVIIDLHQKGQFSYEFREIKPLRDMIILEGKLNDLINPRYYERLNKDSYICAKLTDTVDLYDPLSSLRAVYPNIMQIQRMINTVNINSQTKASSDFKEKDKLSLFAEFYENIIGYELDEQKGEVLKNIIEEIYKDGEEICD